MLLLCVSMFKVYIYIFEYMMYIYIYMYLLFVVTIKSVLSKKRFLKKTLKWTEKCNIQYQIHLFWTEFNLFFQIDRGKTTSTARNWTNSAPQNRRDDLCLVFSLHLSSMVNVCTLLVSAGTGWPRCWVRNSTHSRRSSGSSSFYKYLSAASSKVSPFYFWLDSDSIFLRRNKLDPFFYKLHSIMPNIDLYYEALTMTFSKKKFLRFYA